MSEVKYTGGRAQKRTLKKCEWCRNPFKALAFSRFCSNRCRQAAKNARNRGTHKACTACGTTFMVTHGNQVKCSDCRA